ncbi:MAG: CCA tRNA nucleotidyltransferase, partial [Flavobacteriales bacterium]|nr:CCA tRNA nucleotidyltransferase [Flavobacteriales bacterium]
MNSTKLKEILNTVIFKAINKSAEELNTDAYVIGGFVRDFYLKRGNAKDIDVVAIGSGIELAKQVANNLPGKNNVQVFKNFGTAMVKHNDIDIEFVGARKESYRTDSRKPIVEDGTLEDDQNRRDFTINALAFGLNDNNFGELLDPFGGLEDLKNKVIKTPLDPDVTYSDDPLRMMRAIRFATQLDFEIEQESLDSITRNRDRISIISKERINVELNKIILSEKP